MKMKKLPTKSIVLILAAIFLLGSGCSVQKLAVRSMSGLLEDSMTALFEETDLELAEHAIASDLKLLEGILKSDPENEKYLFMASQGFAAYALGFVEDENPQRAKQLYLRGRDYGLKILRKNKPFRQAEDQELEIFTQSLKKLDKKDVPALFWTANNWGNFINLSMNDPIALADLPRVQAMMERVIELDDSYFFGGAHLFLGTLLAVRPPILGGDMKKAKAHFDRCFELSQGKFLEICKSRQK
ncbi:hypothetical protein B6D60_11105 [candidate division KSB1 bacterium 4484_87]|nr:MAG: hypothetical protein B6D60_11105 [candidate division KSB1 bacterium 4484_87]